MRSQTAALVLGDKTWAVADSWARMIQAAQGGTEVEFQQDQVIVAENYSNFKVVKPPTIWINNFGVSTRSNFAMEMTSLQYGANNRMFAFSEFRQIKNHASNRVAQGRVLLITSEMTSYNILFMVHLSQQSTKRNHPGCLEVRLRTLLVTIYFSHSFLTRNDSSFKILPSLKRCKTWSSEKQP